MGEMLRARMEAFHEALGNAITGRVGTMWCAYLFMLLAFVGFPRQALLEIHAWGEFPHWLQDHFVPWLSQTFIQLVMLAVLQLGQNSQTRSSDKREARQEKKLNEVVSAVRHIHAEIRCSDCNQRPLPRGRHGEP